MQIRLLAAIALLVALLVPVATPSAHIDGATAEFGNTVDLDSNGITIASGTGAINSVKWTDGTQMWSETDTFGLTATDRIFLNGGTTTCGTIVIGQNVMQPSTGDCIDLGTSSQRFRDFYLTDTINWSSPPDTTSADYPMVYSTGNTQIYRKTNGFNGTCSNPTSIEIDRGIVVGCS